MNVKLKSMGIPFEKTCRMSVPWLVRCAIFMVSMARSADIDRVQIYVSPDGNDANAGSEQSPFGTLTKARDAARRLAGKSECTIFVRGGKYFNVSLALNSEDSGLTIQAVPGEKPVLYGGTKLQNWEKNGADFFAAKLPEIPGVNWDIRMLQVNDAFCPRARIPETGTLTHLTVFDEPWMSTTGGGWKRKPTHEELSILQYKPGDLGAWLETKNAEVTVYHMWDDSCVGVSANDVEKRVLTLNPETGHPPGAFGVKKYIVWNVREGLKTPGQWYFDRTQNRIVYWPFPTQDMSHVEAIVPTTTTILHMKGTKEAPVKNVTVRGLGFSVATVPLIAGGFAADHLSGAITLEDTENCVLLDLKIARVAGHGIKGSTLGTRVENCEVSDCGAGGIYIGGKNAVITNNHVHGVGLSYPSSIGIYRGGRDNVVSHNEVHDCTYSGINYGGTNIIIEDNIIYDCMKVLHDGAAIYVFGAKNLAMRRNFVHDITDNGGYGASAYYLDEQSEGCVVENNLSLRVGWPTHNHMAKRNTIRNNVFIVTGDAKMTFPRSSEYSLEKNIVYATGKILIHGSNAITTWSGNIFFSRIGKVEGTPLKDYANAGPSEMPKGDSVLEDPLFENLEKGDYRFKPGSPARKLGIEPIDISSAGRVKR